MIDVHFGLPSVNSDYLVNRMKYESELLGHPIFPESIPLAHLLLRAPGFNLTVIYASQRFSITLIHIICCWFWLILSILSTRLFFSILRQTHFARQRFIIISNCVCSSLHDALKSRWYCCDRVAKVFGLHSASYC